jgi:hypothetical protein
MQEWFSKNFVMEYSTIDTPVLLNDLNLKFSEKPSRASKSYVDVELYKNLNKTKDKISAFPEWEKWSKIINPYEKIQKIART